MLKFIIIAVGLLTALQSEERVLYFKSEVLGGAEGLPIFQKVWKYRPESSELVSTKEEAKQQELDLSKYFMVYTSRETDDRLDSCHDYTNDRATVLEEMISQSEIDLSNQMETLYADLLGRINDLEAKVSFLESLH